MTTHFILFTFILFIPMSKAQESPIAPQYPHSMTHHGDIRIDPYYWLNEYWTDGSKKQDVLDYLNAENHYSEQILAPYKEVQQELYDEILSRIKQTDESVPYFENGYWYMTKYEEGKEYPIYVRKKGSMDAPEELILDVNSMAEGHEYYRVSGLKVSPDNQYLAYSTDTLSRRIYTTYFKNLLTGEILPETLSNTAANIEWAQDSKTVFYCTKDLKTLRENKIWRYQIGTNPKTAHKVYEEKDEAFYTYVSKTKSKRFIQIISESTLSTEIRYLPSDSPFSKFKVFLKREASHLYQIEDFENDFYVLTNWDAENYRLMRSPTDKTSCKKKWMDVIPHRTDVLLEDVEFFKNFFVLIEVREVNTHLKVIPWKNPEDGYYIPFETNAYVAGSTYNPEFDTDKFRFHYQSMITPAAQYEWDMRTGEQKLLKQQEVLGEFNEENYATERLWATATDGTKIPISIAYKKELKRDGNQPLLLYGYGAYGLSSDPYFSIPRLSLLDRGFVYAIAHVRGGEEMGRAWYLNGKMFHKINTFTDFIDCADYLIKEGYTSPKHLYANGGSAGGLLMGAIANMRPDLWNGIISDVPFVDVLTTMLDETIPLTTGEYDEWGNPNRKDSYFYIKSYSPYENIKAGTYPNMMINTGLHDSQVQYFEPAKYVAKLRSLKTDKNILLLNCDMSTGHGGQSGRFRQINEIARDYSFLLMLERQKP